MRKFQEDKSSLFSPDHIFNSFAFLLGASQGPARSENRGVVLHLEQTEGTFKGWPRDGKTAHSGTQSRLFPTS